jgi:hypothetical protein
LKLRDAAVISIIVAHVLAWLVVLFLVLGPVYQGTYVIEAAPGEIPGKPTRSTATLIQVNGWGVLPILLVPAALTGLALLTVLKTGAGQTRRTVVVWVLASLLLVFCALGSFSIGIFYLPSALALVLSGILVSLRRGAQAKSRMGIR